MTVTERFRLAIALTMVGMALGLMISLQFKNVHGSIAFQSLVQQDISVRQVADRVKALKEYNDAEEKALGQLNDELNGYESKASAHRGQANTIQQKLMRVRILAGTVPVKGPGIVLTINDSQQVVPGTDQEASITHDWDIRSVINELFVAGAEAISVNDVRVVSTTGVFCIGPVLKINDQRLGPPFVLKAIGSARDLRAALLIRGGVLDQLTAGNRDLQVSDPKMVGNVEIPAFTGNVESSSTSN